MKFSDLNCFQSYLYGILAFLIALGLGTTFDRLKHYLLHQSFRMQKRKRKHDG